MGCDYCDSGECCTQCDFQIDVVKHPWNSGDLKGSCNEILFTACAMRLIAFGKKSVESFSESNKHGLLIVK